MRMRELDLQAIEKSITQAECETDAEIVVYVANASDTYAWAHAFFGVCGAILAGGTLFVLETRIDWPFTATETLSFEALGALFGSMIPWIPGALRSILPRKWLRKKCETAARLFFLENGLHLTRERNGVLIYVSALERSVEILADAGIGAKLGKPEALASFWQEEVKALVETLRKSPKSGAPSPLTNAIAEAVTRIGRKLAPIYPKTPGNPNELSDRVKRP